MEIQKSYSELVSLVLTKRLGWQHNEMDDRYEVWATEGPVIYKTVIGKPNARWGGIDPVQEASNLSDYIDKYASLANLSIIPRILTDPNNDLSMQRNGTDTVFEAGATGYLDFKIENYEGEDYDHKYLWGADFMCQNGTFGDWAKFQIVDKDNILEMGENVIIKEYVRKKYIFPNVHMSCEGFAPGVIPIGLYLRCEYHSTGSTGPHFAINYHLETKD
jgi:hypothetical protein